MRLMSVRKWKCLPFIVILIVPFVSLIAKTFVFTGLLSFLLLAQRICPQCWENVLPSDTQLGACRASASPPSPHPPLWILFLFHSH